MRDFTDKEIKKYERHLVRVKELYDCYDGIWPDSSKKEPYYYHHMDEKEEFSKRSLIDSFKYKELLYNTIDNMDFVDGDLDPGDAFHFEYWILFKRKDLPKFGFLICSESSDAGSSNIFENFDNEFEECSSLEEVLKLRKKIHDSMIWKNKSDMKNFLSSKEIKQMPWQIKNLKKTCKMYKDCEKELETFLKVCIEILNNQKD